MVVFQGASLTLTSRVSLASPKASYASVVCFPVLVSDRDLRTDSVRRRVRVAYGACIPIVREARRAPQGIVLVGVDRGRPIEEQPLRLCAEDVVRYVTLWLVCWSRREVSRPSPSNEYTDAVVPCG